MDTSKKQNKNSKSPTAKAPNNDNQDLTHSDFETDSQFADISDDDYYTLTFPTHQPRNPETDMLDNDLSDSLSVTSDHQSVTYDEAILCSSDNDYIFHNAPDWAAEYCH